MPLHTKMKSYLDSLPKQPAGFEPKPEEMRKNFNSIIVPLENRPPIHSVEDRIVPNKDYDIPIRIYTPEGEGPFPLYVYFHGGGFVIGSIETHDVNCRKIANLSGYKVISVDYRLAPEHPYPAAPNDCYAATKWVADHAEEIGGDPTRLAVGGPSAGGNLAAVVALMTRDRKEFSIKKQVMEYPTTDLENSDLYPSWKEFGIGYGLQTGVTDQYVLNKGNAKQAYASPIKAKDLAGLPEALIITAEYDPLRDEGERYGARLIEAGVLVHTKRYHGMIHGFLFHPHRELDEYEDGFHLVASFLKNY